MTTTELAAIADRWDHFIFQFGELLGDSDALGVIAPTVAYHAFAALRPLPGLIRSGEAVVTPDRRCDEEGQ